MSHSSSNRPFGKVAHNAAPHRAAIPGTGGRTLAWVIHHAVGCVLERERASATGEVDRIIELVWASVTEEVLGVRSRIERWSTRPHAADDHINNWLHTYGVRMPMT
jgi:hypothetical protein